MSLEKTFQNAKKPSLERKLEVINSKDSVVEDLRAYFEKNKFEGWLSLGPCEEYFNSCMDYLQSLKLTPEIILRFVQKFKTESLQSFGIYLSALMQTSYNQDHNDFAFEEVNVYCFGAFLKGQQENPIRIEVKGKLKGKRSLWYAKNCLLTAGMIKGNYSLLGADHCTLTTKMIEGDDSLNYSKNCILKTKTLKGKTNLWYADGCLAEITNYQGSSFGYRMLNSTIKSENKKTLELIQIQLLHGKNNKFKLIK